MLSEMVRDLMSDNPLLAGPVIAMLLFTTVFVAAVIRVVLAKRDHVDRMAHLPLEGEGLLSDASETRSTVPAQSTVEAQHG